MTRVLGFLVRNWPLKLAAIVLASLLYAGLALSQNVRIFGDTAIPILPRNQPENAVLLSDLPNVTRITYLVSDETVSAPSASSFEATVDLSGVDPTGVRTRVPVTVEPLDDRIVIVSVEPPAIFVELDPLVERSVTVDVDYGAVPTGLEIRDPVVNPARVRVFGPESVVNRVAQVQATVAIEPNGLDIDRDIPLVPVDVLGDRLTRVEVDPPTARVTIPVFANLESRSLQVNPTITGSPGAGFAIDTVTVEPSVITVEGDLDELAGLTRADTEPISLSGATATVEATVGFDLPAGVLPIGEPTVRVTVTLRRITETRSLNAGVQLTGARPDRTYAVSSDRVVVTIFGSPVDLDRIAATSLVVQAPVGDLGPGTHEVSLRLGLPAGLQLVSIAPAGVTVVVGQPPPPPTPPPTAAPEPSPTSPSPSP